MDAKEAKRDRYTTGKLTALAVRRISKRGMHGDGIGLYLQVAEGGSKSWVLRFKVNGRPRHFGLGTAAQRQPLASPHPCRRCASSSARRSRSNRCTTCRPCRCPFANARTMTFDECAEAYIKAHRAGWKNAVHAAQWDSTLKTYVSPVFGSLPAQAIDTALVIRVIEPLWTTKPETAGRLRGRIESILDWARVRGYRTGENPARWKGHLDHLLPARNKVRKVEHHAALPYAEIGNFMIDLRQIDSVPARALEFAS